MKILMKSVRLCLMGIHAELYKKYFDFILNQRIKNGDNISSGSLAYKSNKSYQLCTKFRKYENDLKHEILLKKIVRTTL